MIFPIVTLSVTAWGTDEPVYKIITDQNRLDKLTIQSKDGTKSFFGNSDFADLSSYRAKIPLTSLEKPQSVPTIIQVSSQPPPIPVPAEDPVPPVSAVRKSNLSPPEQDLMIYEANELFHSGRFSDSLAQIEKLLLANPKHARAWTMKGSLFKIMGNSELAVSAWKKALEIDPVNQDLQKYLAIPARAAQ